MERALPQAVIAFASRCRAAGFDIVHPFPVDAVNRTAAATQRLPDFGRPSALGLIVGNTRALWPVFLAAVQRDPALAAAANPLDDHATATIDAAARALECQSVVRYVHALEPTPVGIQRIAEAAGLAHTSPSHLSIHPTYGPWFGFRAVVVLDVDWDVHVPVDAHAVPLAPPRNACATCPGPCIPAFDAALAATRGEPVTSLGATWPLWVRVRDVCPEGVAHRYSDAQIRYHYTKDATVLGLPGG
jgi:methylmalonic aciduria homocystinuria type C protein